MPEGSRGGGEGCWSFDLIGALLFWISTSSEQDWEFPSFEFALYKMFLYILSAKHHRHKMKPLAMKTSAVSCWRPFPFVHPARGNVYPSFRNFIDPKRSSKAFFCFTDDFTFVRRVTDAHGALLSLREGWNSKKEFSFRTKMTKDNSLIHN